MYTCGPAAPRGLAASLPTGPRVWTARVVLGDPKKGVARCSLDSSLAVLVPLPTGRESGRPTSRRHGYRYYDY